MEVESDHTLQSRVDANENQDEVNEEGEEGETLEELKSRHKKEKKEMEGKIRAMIKKAKKKEKASIEQECKEMSETFEKRHQDELLSYEKKMSAKDNAISESSNGEKTVQFALSNLDLKSKEEKRKEDEERQRQLEQKAEEDAILKKKEKNRLKKERKKQKEEEAELAREQEKQFLREIDPRLLELQSLRQQLVEEKRVIKEIPADGNCLYRSIADQLNVNQIGKNLYSNINKSEISEKETEWDFKEIRAIAGNYMESHAEDFLPFLDCYDNDNDDNEEQETQQSKFAKYIENVKHSSEWGGQAELLAISKSLSIPIFIYHASMPKVVMGEEYLESPTSDSSILRISFHEHYLVLGEHYNSVRLAASSG